ncbi:MAG: ABC transporter permease [Thermoflexibacter sp.]
MNTVVKYVVYDIIRNKIVLGYMVFLFVVSFSFFGLESDINKGLLSLLNIVLIIVPLVSVIFSTIHFYNSYEFIELLLTQPLSREKIFLSEYAGVSLALSYAFLMGVGIPTFWFCPAEKAGIFISSGLLLTLTFTSIAFMTSVLIQDKAKGIGVALLSWFYFSLIYDGLVLLLLFSLSDYPLDKLTLVLMALNPVDLSRVMLIMKMDVSALMGYTGAVFKDFLEQYAGLWVATGILLLWVVIPLGVALKIFKHKDL